MDKKLLKIDVTKLRTVANYAKEHDISTTWVYQLAKRGDIKIVEIDGVKFVKIK